MSVKSDVLSLLEASRGAYVSGQSLAERLGVSRAAVWKAVVALKEEGYQIASAPNRGYSLAGDKLSAEGIAACLEGWRHPIQVLETVDSTNTLAKREVALGRAQDGAVILAEEQTAGRGRLGRAFYSPRGNGIYLSIILKRPVPVEHASRLTISAAVAVCQAIESQTAKRPSIKWVNDVFLRERKVCGILTEAVSDFESGMVESAVVGIGLNVRSHAFPQPLADIATSLYLEGSTRNALAAAVISRFFALLEVPWASVLSQYRDRSMVLGRQVSFSRQGQEVHGLATGINNAGNLEVTLADGSRATLIAGDVSIRPLP